jgi:hypothetical protein
MAIKLRRFNFSFITPLQSQFIYALNILQPFQFRQYLGAMAAGLYAYPAGPQHSLRINQEAVALGEWRNPGTVATTHHTTGIG